MTRLAASRTTGPAGADTVSCLQSVLIVSVAGALAVLPVEAPGGG
ncbi:MAG: hypothetical protein WBW92_13325 [Rhodanobacteraceae bacterium]